MTTIIFYQDRNVHVVHIHSDTALDIFREKYPNALLIGIGGED